MLNLCMAKDTNYFGDSIDALKYFGNNSGVLRFIQHFLSGCQIFLPITEPANKCDLNTANPTPTTYIAKPEICANKRGYARNNLLLLAIFLSFPQKCNRGFFNPLLPIFFQAAARIPNPITIIIPSHQRLHIFI